MGMATWPAADGGRPYDAPVLLLPARIEMRGRAGDDMRLVVAGEPQLNPVLQDGWRRTTGCDQRRYRAK